MLKSPRDDICTYRLHPMMQMAKANKAAGKGKKADAPITDMKAHLRTVAPPRKSSVPLSKQVKVDFCRLEML